VRAGDRYDPHTIADLVLMLANDFAQTTPNAIPHNGRTNRPRSCKSGAKSIANRVWKHIKNKKLSALSASALFYLIELFRLG
jgi:hypothetical protein